MKFTKSRIGGRQHQVSIKRPIFEPLEARQLFALTVTPIDPSVNATALANQIVLANTGLTITNGTYVGAADQGATYSGLDFASGTNTLRMDDGILLTSGHANNALPPNNTPGATASLGTAGDPLLDALTTKTTADANSLTITFTTGANVKSIIFDFVFASEEFFEFVGSSFNDAFGAYLDGQQVSLDVNAKPITVNNGFFRLNNSGTAFGNSTLVSFPSQYDGFTPRIRTSAPLVSSGTHTLKLVIADAGDSALDSGVFVTGLQGSTRVLTKPETDLPVPGQLEFAPAPTGSEVSGVANIVVSRVGGSSGKVTATYATTNLSAIAGADYTAATGTVELLDGEVSKTIAIPILNDTLIEEPEFFTISLANPTGGATLPVSPVVAVNVISDDSSLQFSAPTFDVREDAGFGTVTVSRVGGSVGSVSVNYATSNGTATAGTDYTASSGTLTFVDGELTKTFTVPVTSDMLSVEPNETINLTLSNVTGASVILGSPAAAVLNLINVDLQAPTVALTSMDTTRRGITALRVTFDEPIANPADLRAYTIWNRGNDGRNGAGRDATYRIKSVAHDPTTNAVVITPVRPLGFNRVYQLSVNPPFAADTSGNKLDGNADGTGNDNYNVFFGRGSRLSYVDRDGDRINLSVRGGGVIQLLRDFDGEASEVSLIEDTGTSKVSGLLRQTRDSTGTTTLNFVGRDSAKLFNGSQFIEA